MPQKLKTTKYLSLYKTKQGFIYAQRRNINSTASLCFKKEKGKYFFLIRYQPLPIVNTIKHFKWNDCFTCPITGSLEKNQSPIANAIAEVYEEANLKITSENIKSSCKFVPTTQMNETVFCFLIDATKAKLINKKQGDGSIFEKVSYNRWISYQQLTKILKSNNKDLYLSSLAICFNLFKELHGKIKN